ncbi:MAG: hypothetical protein ABIR79_16850 [Candidatus Binatia bacterium]
MVEHHILVCRPLVACESSSELLSHLNITERAARAADGESDAKASGHRPSVHAS